MVNCIWEVERMQTRIFRKGLVVGIICLLILATSPIIYGKNDSDYNLKIKIRAWNRPTLWGFQLIIFDITDITYHIDVYNEGPDSCNNFTVRLDIIYLFGREPSNWFYLFISKEYEGPMIESGDTSSIEEPLENGGHGIWMAKATIISEDNNQEDNIARWFYYVDIYLFPSYKLGL